MNSYSHITIHVDRAAFAQLLDLDCWNGYGRNLLLRIVNTLATAPPHFYLIKRVSFTLMLDTITARIGNMGCVRPLLDWFPLLGLRTLLKDTPCYYRRSFLFRLGLTPLTLSPAPTLSTAGLDPHRRRCLDQIRTCLLVMHILLEDTTLLRTVFTLRRLVTIPTVITLPRLSLTLFCLPTTTISCRRTRPNRGCSSLGLTFLCLHPETFISYRRPRPHRRSLNGT
ncbi:hypothetical protein R3P38DRAFT_3285676, partial [Favolaschia claudopus]